MGRKLAAILAADVVGYSSLMAEDEAATMAALKAHRRDLFEPMIAERGGRIVKLMGDGALVEFPSVVEAVECAIAVQSAMTKRPSAIRLRIGVNLGDVITEGDDIYGDGVNIAVRLEALAVPGGVCISSIVRESIGKRSAHFVDAGEKTVKGAPRPIRVWQWSAARTAETGNASAAPKAEPPLPDKPSIAVLPFTNMSGDPEQEYFSDGITEDIITELSRFRSLFVIARNSSFHYKSQSPKIQDVGRELGVHYVVEGSVRKAGNRVRITAQLIDAQSGSHLWAERYDRDLENIFDVQDEVVDTVTSKLGRSLRDMAFVRARTRPTSNLTAYEHLLRGRAAWWNGDSVDAFRHVERALTADPEYAAAHAWLALQYTYDQFKGDLDLTIEERDRRAHEHAVAALRLDDGDPFVHMAVSMVFCFTVSGDKARALRHSDVAIALNPHDYECMYCRAYVLAVNDRCLEALEWLDRAQRLSPVTAYLLCEGYFDVYRSMGEYEKALEAIRDRGRMPANMYLQVAVAHGCLGHWEVARSWMDRFERERPQHFDVGAYLRFLIDLGFIDKSEQEAISRLRVAGPQILE